MKRECGTCTKCCEGYLNGQALGYNFYQGRPCHFVAIGKGCSVYAKRPIDPCINYKCAWLTNEDIPEWLKPSEINAIVDMSEIKGIKYMRVLEAGQILDSRVLSWLIQYCLSKQLNFYWKIDGGENYIGTQEFVDAMQEKV